MSLAIPHHKVFEDETIAVFIDEHLGLLWLNAELKKPVSVSTVRHWLDVSDSIDDCLKQKGISRLFSVVSDSGRKRFSELMGFVNIGPPAIMYKELNMCF